MVGVRRKGCPEQPRQSARCCSVMMTRKLGLSRDFEFIRPSFPRGRSCVNGKLDPSPSGAVHCRPHQTIRTMKLAKKNLSTLFLILLLGFLTGTFVWELFERILAAAGVTLALGFGPVGFDLYAVSFFVRVNPGSVLGLIGGAVVFRSV